MGILGSVDGPHDPDMPPVDEKWRSVARVNVHRTIRVLRSAGGWERGRVG